MGYPHGKGTKFLVNGTVQEGQWEKGKLIPAQSNQIVRKSGIPATTEVGCISGDCLNGKGIFIYPSGAMYIGEFKNNEIHGIGVCYYSDGSKYQGEWIRRYPEGNGTKVYSDGSKRSGRWKRGEPSGSEW